MGLNIGIILGVSEYTTLKSLPAGANDAQAVADLLRGSQRFDDVLLLVDRTDAVSIKDSIAEFVDRHRTDEISELFFYYSGHGEAAPDDYYFQLSGYETSKKRTTSLSNSELDEFARALSPSLYVKVVDACYSAVSYVKSGDDVPSNIESASPNFKKLYFMFSSANDQKSWQGGHLSDFTECFIKAIVDHKSDTVRYKDVANYVSDYFDQYDWQTPWFVQQSSNMDILCEVTPQLREQLAEYVRRVPDVGDQASQGDTEEVVPAPVGEAPAPPPPPPTLKERVVRDAARYVQKEQAIAAFATLRDATEEKSLRAELADLYEKSVIEQTSYPRESAAIGQWISQSKEDPKFFAKPTFSEESYKKRVPLGGSSATGILGNLNRLLANPLLSENASDAGARYKYEDATRQVIAGYALTCEVPYRYLKVTLHSEYLNLPPRQCDIAPVVSLATMRLFWSFMTFEYADWGRATPVGLPSWNAVDIPLREDEIIHATCLEILGNFEQWVFDSLQEKLGT